MREFPAVGAPSVEIALTILRTRYVSLNADHITTQLAPLSAEQFNRAFLALASSRLHEYLFQGLISNAGQYRLSTDPGDGRVYFGLGQKFQGIPPHEIEKGILAACANLSKEDQTPLLSVTKFYQQFVFVHPFYDANGRIARFIMDAYLNFHGVSFSWTALHNSGKWLKKLNDCHKRYPGVSYDSYIIRLAKYFEKYAIRERIPNE